MDLTKKTAAVVFVDADNTLWDTDGVFARAQLALLESVESAVGSTAPATDRLAYVRELDQALAERHHAGLRYPPRFLVKALALALTGTPSEVAARLAWSGGQEGRRLPEDVAVHLEGEILARLRIPPPLRPGVQHGLAGLHAIGCLVLVLTEGNRQKAINTAEGHGLVASFHRVIEGKKERRLFERILRLMGNPSEAFMVGDQLERDIRPAKEAGLRTIYFPGGFRPRWEPAEATVRPDYRIESFDEVPDIILAECRREQRGPVTARE